MAADLDCPSSALHILIRTQDNRLQRYRSTVKCSSHVSDQDGFKALFIESLCEHGRLRLSIYALITIYAPIITSILLSSAVSHRGTQRIPDHLAKLHESGQVARLLEVARGAKLRGGGTVER
jgi:hypothetical protein